MIITQLMHTALRSINHHKSRSLLTMLGVIIGITCIIAMMSIGYSTQEHMRQKLLSMGNNYIFVCADRAKIPIHKTAMHCNPQKLTIDDVTAIKKQCPAIKWASPHFATAYEISREGKSIHAIIKSGNEQYLNITGKSVLKGMPFTQEHLKKKAKVVLIGADLARSLFSYKNPVGSTILIKNTPFTILGILKNIAYYDKHDNPNMEAIIPFSTVKSYLVAKKRSSRKIAGMVFSAQNHTAIPSAVRQLKNLLRSRHRLSENEPDDFKILDQLTMIKAAQHSSDILSIFLIIIASISLLIGGIGIMNIMLVCVSERRQEIGIRMALGASSWTIQMQFMIEALIISIMGGIIGALLGIMFPFIANYISPWTFYLDYNSLYWVSFILIFFGIIFGYYPARKASLLDPITALRIE